MHKQAIVIGGSMAGLFTARVLSDHFEQVTVIERDQLPDGPDFRGGAPQARHLHQLLMGGQQVMERLFPALRQDLEEIGSKTIHWGYNWINGTAQGIIQPLATGLYSNTCSRAGLEYLIRRRLQQIPNVQFETGYDVAGLMQDGETVIGVYANKRPGKEQREFRADLVVDASGRRSKAGNWLQDLGYEAVQTTHVDAHIGYATCWFEKPDYALKDIVVMMAKPHLTNGRAGIIFEVEGNRWVAILTSKNRDYPPQDMPGFLAFAQTLSSPIIYNYLKDATPTSPIYGYRSTDNLWRHYEKMSRYPDNFIILGDAACAFNPIYGQGMSVAAMEAEMLGKLLDDPQWHDLKGFSKHFQHKLAKMVAMPFALASADDLQQPTVEGDIPQQSWMTKQIGLYFRDLINVIDYDPVVAVQFLKVMNLLAGPGSLLLPHIVLRVIWHKLRGTPPLPQKTFGTLPVLQS